MEERRHFHEYLRLNSVATEETAGGAKQFQWLRLLVPSPVKRAYWRLAGHSTDFLSITPVSLLKSPDVQFSEVLPTIDTL